MSRVTCKPSRLKNLATENGSLRSGKGARPQRTEGKRHRNQNGQRKLEQGSINNQGVQRSGTLLLVSSRPTISGIARTRSSPMPSPPSYRLPHPCHPPPLFLCPPPTHATYPPLVTSPHASCPAHPRYQPFLITMRPHLGQSLPHTSFSVQQ